MATEAGQPRLCVERRTGRSADRRTAVLLGGLILTCLSAPAPAGAQTTTLRGELLLRDGQPATGTRLVIIGHPPEVVLRDGALFTHQLVGAPSEVTVRVVGAASTEILYPPAGRVVVPQNEAAVVSIVVGEPIGAAVEDRIEQDLRAIRETLEVRGVPSGEIDAIIRTELDSLSHRLANIAREAVVTAVAGAEQADIRERVNRYLGTYVRVTRDLVDAFDLIDVTASIGMSEFLAVYDAIDNYNRGFAELDRELTEIPTAIERAWLGEEGGGLAEQMRSLMTLIRSEVHAEMLALRGPLTVIQREFTGSRPSRAELNDAKQAIASTLPRLHPALTRLEEATPSIVEALRRQDHPTP